MSEIQGKIIGGSFDRIFLRQKKSAHLEIGDLLVAVQDNKKILFKVIDLVHSSQVSQSNIEYISGVSMEETSDIELMDDHLRYYSIAELKSILAVVDGAIQLNKQLPSFFSDVRLVTADDLTFFSMPSYPLYFGKIRSGSKVIDSDVFLDGKEVLSHHILVAATTGRGKSNLTSCVLWNLLLHEYAGVLVLDPHDEYYGRNSFGLKDHPHADRISYYTPFSIPPGGKSLTINVSKIRPDHFNGALSFTDAQNDALYAYYKKYKKDWIKELFTGDDIQFNGKQLIHEGTLAVVRRKLMKVLTLSVSSQGEIECSGIFDTVQGTSTISDICKDLENGKMVIVDTSHFSGSLEILVGSMVASEIFNRYRLYKRDGTLVQKPVISIVIEEAPRVLGKEILERGTNVFGSIAKEGRKFKIGLFAITQLPSLIPRDILANMNTKIILGIEMAAERQAIIDSAAQDLTADSRMIAALDKGESVVTTNFAKFAMPIKIPLFKDYAKKTGASKLQNDFSDLTG